MKVLYLANPLRSGTGGDRRSFEVLQRVKSIGIEPVIVVDDFIWRKMNASGFQFDRKQKIYSIKRTNVLYGKYFKSAIRAVLDYYSIFRSANIVAQIAKQEHVDFIVSHHEKIDFLLEAYIAAKKCKVPWTCIFQLPFFPPYASTSWRRVGSIRRVYLFGLYGPLYTFIRKAVESTSLLSVSPSIEVELKNYFGGWKGKMLVLWPSVGVDHKKIKSVEPSNERVDGIFFSRLVAEKGIFDLPKLAAKIVEKKPDFRFVVVGSFDSVTTKNAFEEAVRDSGVEKNIVCKGFVDEKVLQGLLESAKVLIYPSRYDAFPLVVLEALASGTPVVAYDIPPIRLNFPADAVRMVPVGNYELMAAEALKIISDDKLRRALSMEAVVFAGKYSWENVAEAEEKSYSVVLKP
jgi:glycosyltransferase involved in cell wall biosynthesis